MSYMKIQGPPSTGSSDDNDEQLYCVCRRPNSPEKPMAQCSQCKDWFHPTCVGCKDIEDIAVISPWLCPNCATRQTEKTTLKKTKLSFIIRNNDCEQTGRDYVDMTKQNNDNEDTHQTKQCDEPEHNPSQSQFTITLTREEWEMIKPNVRQGFRHLSQGWTDIISEKVGEKMHCILSFKYNRVRPETSRKQW